MRFALLAVAAGLCAGCMPTESPDAAADDAVVTISVVEPETPTPSDAPTPPARPKFPGDSKILALAEAPRTATPPALAPKADRMRGDAATAAGAEAPAPAAAEAPAAVAGEEGALAAVAGEEEAAEAEAEATPKGPDGQPLKPAIIRPFAGARYFAAYPHVRIDCFPEDLRVALTDIAEHFKADVQVTSGFRDRGRRGSMHRSCKAADIRVAGVRPSALAAYARTVGGLNGVGTYRYTSVIHVDTRLRRFAWRY